MFREYRFTPPNGYEESDFLQLASLLENLHIRKRLVEMVFERTATAPFKRFSLVLEFVDGARWEQSFGFDVLMDPFQNFGELQGDWRDVPLLSLRPIRVLLVDFVGKYPQLQQVKAELNNE